MIFIKKNFGLQSWAKNYVFWHFHKFASLVFLDIAQVCNLDQGVTSGTV